MRVERNGEGATPQNGEKKGKMSPVVKRRRMGGRRSAGAGRKEGGETNYTSVNKWRLLCAPNVKHWNGIRKEALKKREEAARTTTTMQTLQRQTAAAASRRVGSLNIVSSSACTCLRSLMMLVHNDYECDHTPM